MTIISWIFRKPVLMCTCHIRTQIEIRVIIFVINMVCVLEYLLCLFVFGCMKVRLRVAWCTRIVCNFVDSVNLSRMSPQKNVRHARKSKFDMISRFCIKDDLTIKYNYPLIWSLFLILFIFWYLYVDLIWLNRKTIWKCWSFYAPCWASFNTPMPALLRNF